MLELSLIILFGLFMGVMIGLLPGLPAFLGLILLYPFIDHLTIDQILAYWLTTQIGSQYFGSVAAILLKIPGEASSMVYLDDLDQVSAHDRYDLVRQTAWGSTVGSLFSLAALLAVYYLGVSDLLILLTKMNVKIAVLSLLVFTLIWFTERRSISALLFLVGMFFAEKTNQNLPTWVFDMQRWSTDITVFSLLLSMIVIPEFIEEVKKKINKDSLNLNNPNNIKDKLDLKSIFRGTWIGSLVGFIPGPSTMLASIVSYNSYGSNDAKDAAIAKKKIISAEAANNSAAITSLLPFIYVGLPITLSEMILYDFLNVKLFIVPTHFPGASIVPHLNYIEFTFAMIAVATLTYHFLAQKFLRFYEIIINTLYGKLMWLYFILISYIIYIDVHFNPVNIYRYIVFLIILTLAGMWMLRRRISSLPLLFGYILGDMIMWSAYNFYRIHII